MKQKFIRLSMEEWHLGWLAWGKETNNIVPSQLKELDAFIASNPDAPINNWKKLVQAGLVKIGSNEKP